MAAAVAARHEATPLEAVEAAHGATPQEEEAKHEATPPVTPRLC